MKLPGGFQSRIGRAVRHAGRQYHAILSRVDNDRVEKVHMQETSVKKGTKGWFSIKVSHVRGYALYDLKKDTYKTHWVLLMDQE